MPDPSFARAESCCLPPETRLNELGETVTLLMAPAETINVAEPLLPLVVAVIVTEPACEAVTRPVEDTVPMEVLELDQETGSPETTFPEPSLIVAESCWVLPAASPSDPGVTATVATEPAPTCIVALALFPSDVAVIVALPT